MATGSSDLTRMVIKLGGRVRSLQDQSSQMATDIREKAIIEYQHGLQFIYKRANENNIDLTAYYQALADIEGRLNTLQSGISSKSSNVLDFPEEKIALFIDAPNLSKACSEWLKRDIDYAKLLGYFSKDATVLRAYYYIGIDSDDDLQSNPFLFWLRRNGFRLVTKQIKTFSDGVRKGNLDIEIAIDMLELVNHIDRAVLFSGDGDFAPLLDRVGMKGVRTQVVAYWGRGEGPTARELMDAADIFTDLADIVDEIARS